MTDVKATLEKYKHIFENNIDLLQTISDEIRDLEAYFSVHCVPNIAYKTPDESFIGWDRKKKRIMFVSADKEIVKPFGDTNANQRMLYRKYLPNLIEEMATLMEIFTKPC